MPFADAFLAMRRAGFVKPLLVAAASRPVSVVKPPLAPHPLGPGAIVRFQRTAPEPILARPGRLGRPERWRLDAALIRRLFIA